MNTLYKKAGILLLFFYLLLYMFPFPLDQIPVISIACDFYYKGIGTIAVWIGKWLFHFKGLSYHESEGSGDTLLDYARIPASLALSAVFTGALLLFGRKKWDYRRWYPCLLVYARYYLGLYMLVYGFIKLSADYGQFSPPSLFRLEKTYGASSPMNLLWTFMGGSHPYRVFSGIMELTGGYLLLFRRTKTIGAMLAAAVMTNVAVMNFCYDVPVKLFSCHLVFIALLILGTDLQRIFSFLLGLKTEMLDYRPLVFSEKYKRVLYYGGQALIVLGFSVLFIYSDFFSPELLGPGARAVKLDGVYKPVLLIQNSDTLVSAKKAPVVRKFILQSQTASITSAADSVWKYRTKIDSVKKILHLIGYPDSTETCDFTYREENGKLYLTGTWKGKVLQAEFTKRSEKDYLLMNRGFHWVNEVPFNR